MYLLFSNLLVLRSEPVLPLLTFAQKKGNTTFYEWRTGHAPVVVDKPVMDEAPADTVTEETVSLTASLLTWDCKNTFCRWKAVAS